MPDHALLFSPPCGLTAMGRIMSQIRVNNILSVYRKAKPEEIRQGRRWYHVANNAAGVLAIDYGISVGRTSAIIACLSPGLKWERNIEVARRVLADESLDGLGVRWYNGVHKAKRIIRGHNPDYAIKGNKVKAFRDCILHPDNAMSVCIDGHAYSMWVGKRIPLASARISKRLYQTISADYVAAAKVVGLGPMQLQAITWLTWRRLHQVSPADKIGEKG